MPGGARRSGLRWLRASASAARPPAARRLPPARRLALPASALLCLSLRSPAVRRPLLLPAFRRRRRWAPFGRRSLRRSGGRWASGRSGGWLPRSGRSCPAHATACALGVPRPRLAPRRPYWYPLGKIAMLGAMHSILLSALSAMPSRRPLRIASNRNISKYSSSVNLTRSDISDIITPPYSKSDTQSVSLSRMTKTKTKVRKNMGGEGIRNAVPICIIPKRPVKNKWAQGRMAN